MINIRVVAENPALLQGGVVCPTCVRVSNERTCAGLVLRLFGL